MGFFVGFFVGKLVVGWDVDGLRVLGDKVLDGADVLASTEVGEPVLATKADGAKVEVVGVVDDPLFDITAMPLRSMSSNGSFADPRFNF